MPGMWMSVSGDGGDLHSIFFYNFKSFLKTFDFHGNRAWNLGTAFTFNTTTFWLCTSKKKCMYLYICVQYLAERPGESTKHNFCFSWFCFQFLMLPKASCPFCPTQSGLRLPSVTKLWSLILQLLLIFLDNQEATLETMLLIYLLCGCQLKLGALRELRWTYIVFRIRLSVTVAGSPR